MNKTLISSVVALVIGGAGGYFGAQSGVDGQIQEAVSTERDMLNFEISEREDKITGIESMLAKANEMVTSVTGERDAGAAALEEAKSMHSAATAELQEQIAAANAAAEAAKAEAMAAVEAAKAEGMAAAEAAKAEAMASGEAAAAELAAVKTELADYKEANNILGELLAKAREDN